MKSAKCMCRWSMWASPYACFQQKWHLCCKLWIDRLNSLGACSTVCHASCIDGVRKVTGSGFVMLSFTGSDVAAPQCGEQVWGVDRNDAIRFNHPVSEFTGFLWFSSLWASRCRKHALKTVQESCLTGSAGWWRNFVLLLMPTQLWRPVACAE